MFFLHKLGSIITPGETRKDKTPQTGLPEDSQEKNRGPEDPDLDCTQNPS